MSDQAHVDGHAVEIGTELAHVPAAAPANLFGTDDPVEVVAQAARVADALKDVIVQKQLFTMIQGKPHIGVEGWQLVGAMLGVTAVCVHTETIDGGYKATVEARTVDGRVIGSADALCTKHEKRGPWKTADDYARLSMAQTRATSKALKGPLGFVVSLAGYATTPAEEMTHAEPDPPPAAQPPAAAAAAPALLSDAARGRVVQAFEDAGITDMTSFLTAVGVESTDDLTKAHAARLRVLLDDYRDKAAAGAPA